MSDKNCGIGNFFDKIEDPRINRTRMHELIDIITIGLCSILAGCEGFSDMEHFGNSKQDWFKSFLRLPNGIPSHDTFRRVFSSINPKQFESAFFKWTNAIVSEINGRHIAVDGKCLRASGRKRTKKSPIHLVSAWCSDEGGIIVGQEKTDEKSNEITAIPHLLEALDLKGAIVSIDAAGCQKNIAKQITEQEGDFVLALKGNHKKLHEEVQEKSQEWISKTSNFNEDNFHDYFDESHGRLVRRRIWVITKLDLKNLTEWPHVKSILVVENIRSDKTGPVTCEFRYYLSSLSKINGVDADRIIRGHWTVENQLHWSLDVTFNEDASRVSDQNAAQNLGALRRIAISLLKKDATKNLSLRKKKLKCGFDDKYLMTVLSMLMEN